MFSGPIRYILQTILKHKSQEWWSFKQYREKVTNEYHVRRELKHSKRCSACIVGLGGVGKSLAHLLKMYPGELTELRLCNRSDREGIIEELSQLPTKIVIKGFTGAGKFLEGLRNADIVIMCAGASRKTDMPREKLFVENAGICSDLINTCADVCPNALIAIVTNPIDSLVPVASEVLRKRGISRPGKIFGVCQLDLMRAQRYYAEAIGAEPEGTYVPVVGGHSDATIVPLFSRGRPNIPLPPDAILRLVKTVRAAGTKVVQANKGAGGTTYSMASAAMYIVHKLCRAIHHEPHLIISAYVESSVTRCRFFSNELMLGPDGVYRNLGFGKVTDIEQKMIDDAVAVLQRQVALAEDFVAKRSTRL